MKNPDVDTFVAKAKLWRQEIEDLRTILLSAKLDESLKWGKPCYSFGGGNVAIIQPFKNCLELMFFKGTLLKDPKNVLVDNGPNSQAARRMEFTSAQEVSKLKTTVKAYIKEAMDFEVAGHKVTFQKNPGTVPDELNEEFRKKPQLKRAFEALTPGRQRAYLLHFSAAKKSETRKSRIDACAPRILMGKGRSDP